VRRQLLFAIMALIAVPPFPLSAQDEARPNNPVSQIQSPNGRYQVEFSQPRTAATNSGSRLWAAITVRDLQTGAQRTAHVAEGQRGSGDTWQAFSPFEDEHAWSPDGLYVAYLNCGCLDQAGVPGFDAVCHNDIVFLAMVPPPSNSHELALGTVQFGGWASGHPHTVIEIDAARSDGTNHRRLPYLTGRTP